MYLKETRKFRDGGINNIQYSSTNMKSTRSKNSIPVPHAAARASQDDSGHTVVALLGSV